jgi:hypothetical protein
MGHGWTGSLNDHADSTGPVMTHGADLRVSVAGAVPGAVRVPLPGYPRGEQSGQGDRDEPEDCGCGRLAAG